jgi:MoaA/NifB/PqqE/SkfB family radical SAM enzyme
VEGKFNWNESAMNNKYKPHFISGWKLQLSMVKYLFSKYTFQKKKYPLFNRSLKQAIHGSRRIRDKLNLTRIVSFDKQNYSTPTIPAYPSKAYDHFVANGGLNFHKMGTEYKKQLDSVFLAITDKCSLNCSHCYEKHNLMNSDAETIEAGRWKDVIQQIQKKGVSIIILTGGEPLDDFDKLLMVTTFIDKDLSDIHLHTSGNGVTEEKVMHLKKAGIKAVAVGLDDYDEKRFDQLRNKKGAFNDALKALELFNNAGIFTYLNACITHKLITEGSLFDYYEFAKTLNIGIIQLLEPRPFGGYNNSTIDDVFTSEDKTLVREFCQKAMRDKMYKNYPIIYYVAEIESKNRMGCCMGGLSHFYIDCKGNVNPCVFLPITFGNIKTHEFETIYSRMREVIPRPIKTVCPSLHIGERLIDKDKIKYPIHIDLLNDNLRGCTYKEIFTSDIK